MVPTTQPGPDFSCIYGIREVVDHVELITCMKFQNILMPECKDIGKQLQKYPQNGFFPHF